jgi:cell division protein ZapA (FtsZ GTPase activity inhibitor)
MSTDPEESHIDWANRTFDGRKAELSASVPTAATDKLTATVVVSHEVVACTKCKALKQKLEDTEGALEGVQNIIRQLRDAASREKEWA